MTALRKRLPSVSIRYALPLLLATLMIVAIGLTGLLAFRSGQAAVDELATRLSAEVTRRIEDHVLNFVEIPHLFNEVNLSLIKAGVLAVDNEEHLARVMGSQVHLSSSVPYIYLGTEAGHFLGVDSNFAEGQIVLKIRDDASAPERITYRLNEPGQRGEELERDEYDPRSRPWYQAAAQAGRATWSPIIVFAARPILGISSVTPIYDENHKLYGVWGVNLRLAELTDFLRGLEISPHGQALIIEKSGDLVATSGQEPPFIITDEGEVRLKIVDSQEPLLRAAASHLVEKFGGFEQITSHQASSFEFEGERTFVEVSPLTDERGLDWLTVVIIPARDFTEPVYANLRTTIFLGLLVLGGAATLGFALARWIIRPIFVISDVAANIEASKFDLQPLAAVIGRKDELGQLARVFERMAGEVHAREEQLKQQVQVLRIEIDETKRLKQVKEIVETDFFADLQAKAQNIRQRRNTPAK